MMYNAHGDRIAEISEDQNSSIDERGRLSEEPTSVNRSEARLHYNYDARGNWTTKEVETRSDAAQQFCISSIEHRVLLYYDD